MNSSLVTLPALTDEGLFLAHYSEKGLAELDWPAAKSGKGGKPLRSPTTGAAPAPQRPSGKIREWHRLTMAALKNILAGRAAKSLPPLDWTGKTEFQQAVWREMLKLDTGETKSYGEVAAAIGKPQAVRAVGSACGANPIPLLVPCHRILAANRKIGGFTGGLDRKRSLLELEGVPLAGQ